MPRQVIDLTDPSEQKSQSVASFIKLSFDNRDLTIPPRSKKQRTEMLARLMRGERSEATESVISID